MNQELLQVRQIPAVLYGKNANKVWLFVHGKCGCKEEGLAFAEIVCPKGWQVLAIDLPAHGARKEEPGFDPWHVVPELREVMTWLRHRWGQICLRANSLGAWFSMLSFADTPPEKALLVSPVLNMEKLIIDMMRRAAVDEVQLEQKGEIPTISGEILSWKYLQYAKTHRIVRWDVPTEILYAGQDCLTDRNTAETFAMRFGCGISIMENGEHWFHTPEQLRFLQLWEEQQTIF